MANRARFGERETGSVDVTSDDEHDGARKPARLREWSLPDERRMKLEPPGSRPSSGGSPFSSGSAPGWPAVRSSEGEDAAKGAPEPGSGVFPASLGEPPPLLDPSGPASLRHGLDPGDFALPAWVRRGTPPVRERSITPVELFGLDKNPTPSPVDPAEAFGLHEPPVPSSTRRWPPPRGVSELDERPTPVPGAFAYGADEDADEEDEEDSLEEEREPSFDSLSEDEVAGGLSAMLSATFDEASPGAPPVAAGPEKEPIVKERAAPLFLDEVTPDANPPTPRVSAGLRPRRGTFGDMPAMLASVEGVRPSDRVPLVASVRPVAPPKAPPKTTYTGWVRRAPDDGTIEVSEVVLTEEEREAIEAAEALHAEHVEEKPRAEGPRGAAEAEEDRLAVVRACFERGDHLGVLAHAETVLESDPSCAAALRYRDSARALLRRSRLVPTLGKGHGSLGDLRLDPRAAFVLSLVDGAFSIDDVVDMASMPPGETLRRLHELRERGIVVLSPRRTQEGR